MEMSFRYVSIYTLRFTSPFTLTTELLCCNITLSHMSHQKMVAKTLTKQDYCHCNDVFHDTQQLGDILPIP